MNLPRIGIVHPGHAMSTAWVYDGMKTALDFLGCELTDCRTDKLIAFSTSMLESQRQVFENEQGANFDVWAKHVAQQLGIVRLMEMQNYNHPDLYYFICGRIFTKQNYELMDMLNLPKVVALTESPYEDDSQIAMLEHFDFAFTNDRISVPRLSAIAPTVYLPHAYDDDVFYPADHSGFDEMGRSVGHHRPSLVKDSVDVSFIGTPFHNRKPYLDALKAMDIPQFIFDDPVKKDEEGRLSAVFVSPTEAAKVYHRSKICVNIHRANKYYGKEDLIDEAYSVGPRTFDIAGAGEFQICDNTRAELQDIFGDVVPTFGSVEEMVELVRYWSDDARTKERRDRGMAAHDIVAARHTYTHRAYQVVKQLSVWYNRPEWKESLEEKFGTED